MTKLECSRKGKVCLKGDFSLNLQNRVVVITGASSGIGEATALQFAAQGAKVVLVARSGAKLTELQQRIEAQGQEALVIPTDVSNAAQVKHLATQALAYYGQVDVLVNGAGFGIWESFPKANFTDLEEMTQVNLYGTVRCIEAFLPQMLARKQGQLINIASLAGLLSFPNFTFYSATKFAVVGFTRSLQLDLRGTGVKCALICPGIVRTAFYERANMEKLGRASQRLPWLEAEDVAQAIVQASKKENSGEIILPVTARPLVALAGASPALAKWLLHWLG